MAGDGAEIDRLSRELKAVGEKYAPTVRKVVTRETRPERVAIRDRIRSGVGLPHSGGLDRWLGRLPAMATDVRPGKVSIKVLLRRRVSDMKRLNEGQARHPVFGNRKVWAVTRIRAGWWEAAVDPSAARLQRVVEDRVPAEMESLLSRAGLNRRHTVEI